MKLSEANRQKTQVSEESLSGVMKGMITSAVLQRMNKISRTDLRE